MQKLFLFLALSAVVSCTSKVPQSSQPKPQVKPIEVAVVKESPKSGTSSFIIKNSKNEVFFKFDSYELSQLGKDKIKEFSRILQNDKVVKINLAGYADERGTKEYNFVLGMKRAEAVRNEFTKYGYSKDSFNLVSFGNSVIENAGNTEEAHSLNRKVKISITINQ